jgi:hypothetical protein
VFEIAEKDGFSRSNARSSPEHNVRSTRMGSLSEGEKDKITRSSPKGQPKLARTRIARDPFINGRYRSGESVELSEIAIEYQSAAAFKKH